MPLKDPTPTDMFWLPGGTLGLSDEEHWNDLMLMIGAERIDRIVAQPSFRNADYVWHAEQLVIELKNLNVDLAEQPGFATKVTDIIQNAESPKEAYPEIAAVIRRYMKDIVCSANKQIKCTKKELGLSSYNGVILIVNSGFSSLSFAAASQCFRSIINSKTQFSSVSGLIYIEDFEKQGIQQEVPYYIGQFGTHKMTVDTELSMLMITKGWETYLKNPWLRVADPGTHAIRFEAARQASRHWKPSDVRAYVVPVYSNPE
jgi:hypothetical protein